jgi:hypothetical protein
MRTTLTLDPDVAALLEQEVHRQRKPLKQVVNEALRRSLSGQGKGPKVETYRTVPHRARLMPGIDRGSFNRLADELEDDAIAAKLHKK